jgi:hypothetical protein
VLRRLDNSLAVVGGEMLQALDVALTQPLLPTPSGSET